MNFFNLSMSLKGFPLREAQTRIAELLAFPEKDLQKWQNDQKWAIAKYHLQYNPIYRQKLQGQLPQHWDQLPVIKKADFFQPMEQLLASDYSPDTVYLSKTSGSSGKPLLYAKDKYCHALTWARILAAYQEHGIEYGSSFQARFYAIPMEQPAYQVERIKDWLSSRYRFVIHNMEDAVLEKYLNRFSRSRFDYVYGYTNSIALFAQFLKRKNLVLKKQCPSIRCCIVTSEVCTPSDRELIETWLGVPVVNEYGASELDLIAFQNPKGEWQLNRETLYVEILDDHDQPLPDGATGRIVVTALFNQAMPFIRYELGDRGAITANGRLLDRLEGRLNDVVKLPSGKLVPGFTLYYITKAMMKDIPGFREYNIKQTALDCIEYDIVCDQPLNDKHKKKIEELTFQYLEPNIRVLIREVALIERGVNGKMKHFQSLI
ncbi:MAG TPA: hypothetical protein PKA00_13430 [Saprospiraceae bacterium]|nr:hypothetical protein [Saprospiraceae bacterium]HMQ83911.1 hypothetical protein [Saprospiraceae bacterium]